MAAELGNLVSKYIVKRPDDLGDFTGVPVERAIYEALLDEEQCRRKGIEKQARATASCLARLMDFLLQKDLLPIASVMECLGKESPIWGTIEETKDIAREPATKNGYCLTCGDMYVTGYNLQHVNCNPKRAL